ncbi:DUF4350 domain-containing protein [Microbacterium marinilacus]|nr:DUF4350 domain-containing protein [Microbacterium marinilacus]
MLGWGGLVLVLVVLAALVALSAARDWTPRPALDPEGPGRDGARAIANILVAQGVDVVPTTRREETLSALDTADGGTTLVITDTWYLSDEDLLELTAAAEDAVVLDPRGTVVDLFVPGASHAGYGSAPTDPGCDLPTAQRAGQVVPGRAFTAPAGVTGCYPVGDGFALLSVPHDEAGAEGTVTLIDGVELFGNARLAEEGNAALGLGLIGTHDRVVWYVPSALDADAVAGAPTLGDLVPPWVTPAIVLLIAAAVAAAVWRGRRLGPLVAERLPVTVRGSETLEGRARLYARAADAAHAADLLRDGAVARMARRLGLASGASEGETADAAAARLGASAGDVRAILGLRPRTDPELAEFGARLRDLETAVDAAVHSAAERPA